MKAAIIMLMLCLGASAHAADWLLTPLASHHASPRADGQSWQERNFGIGFERDTTRSTSVMAIAYRNSFDRTTLGIGGSWRPLQLDTPAGNLSAGITALAATGYPTPVIAAPGISWRARRAGIDLHAAPSIGKGTTAFVALQLRFRLD